MTSARSPVEFARNFPENGMKLLLQRGENVRDLLNIASSPLAELLAFNRLETDPTTYVQPDYRHIESDLVLRVPLKGRRRSLIVYILLEHQSETDRLMLFRTLQYLVAILSSHLRQWAQEHDSLEGFRFQPVLPIVFYTGTGPWPDLGQLADLFVDVPELAPFIPTIRPLFVNLRDANPSHLMNDGGGFGQIMRVYQERELAPSPFEALLDEVVTALESMTRSTKIRWQELMSYLHALVYHVRGSEEHEELFARIENSVRNHRLRKEVSTMKRTIADMLREEGEITGESKGRLQEARSNLSRFLRKRFGKLSPSIVSAIESCQDLEQLHSWIDAAAKAQSMEEVLQSVP